MKKLLTLLFISSALLMSANAAAFSSKSRSEECKKPAFKNFSLTEYKAPDKIEIAPESEFSFIVSSRVESTTIKITAKKKKLTYKIENKGSFYKITSKIPAEFSGKFVRINVFAKAKLECKGIGGWLIKVAEKKTEPEAEIKVEEPVTAEPEVTVDVEKKPSNESN